MIKIIVSFDGANPAEVDEARAIAGELTKIYLCQVGQVLDTFVLVRQTQPNIFQARSQIAQQVSDYHLENIRALFNKGYSDADWRDFTFDHAEFRPVYDRLASITGKDEMVRYIVAYADQQNLMEVLLAWAKEKNPARYAQHSPYKNG